jgi:hypothetical protein
MLFNAAGGEETMKKIILLFLIIIVFYSCTKEYKNIEELDLPYWEFERIEYEVKKCEEQGRKYIIRHIIGDYVVYCIGKIANKI